MTTAIVTDSTTSLLPGVEGRPDLRIVPLTFHFGAEESYLDKVEMSNAEFYDRLKSSREFPTTSQPSAGQFVEAFESLSAYENILVLTISGKLSGTFDSATSAAGMVDIPVEVVDTRSAEMGSGLVLGEALSVVDEGGDHREAKRAVENAIRKLQVFFAVGTLEYLAKSGRIGRAQRLVGTALDVRPVLTLEDGGVIPFKRARGRKRQMNAIVEELQPAVAAGKKLFFGHVDAEDALLDLTEKLGISRSKLLVADLGGVVGAHVGPGAYGVASL